MTAICAGPDSHPDARGRYAATVFNGIFFIAFGLAGATAVSLIQALPVALVGVIAGLALLPVILQAFALATGQTRHALAAGFALLIAASNINLVGINSAFWAIVAGVAVARLVNTR